MLPLLTVKGEAVSPARPETDTDKMKRKTARLQVCGSGCVCVHVSGTRPRTEGRERRTWEKKEGNETHEHRAAGGGGGTEEKQGWGMGGQGVAGQGLV